MKRILSLFLICCMSIQLVAFAEESADTTSEISIECSENTVYNTEDISESNCGTLSSVSKLVVSGEYDYYTVHSSSNDAKVYSTYEMQFKSVDSSSKLNTDAFIHTAEPGLYTVNVVVYKDNKVACSKNIDLECKFEDSRDVVAPERIKIGNSEFTEYTKNVYEYSVDTVSVDKNTTVTVENTSGDSSEVIKDGNKVYIVTFNRDKSKYSIHSIDFKYDYVGSLDVTVPDSAITNELVSYSCTYNGVDVTDIVNVGIDSDKGFKESKGKIHLIKGGLTTVKFSLGTATVEKTINVTGDDIIDEPQHKINIENLENLVVGDIINVKYTSNVFLNDNRFELKSSNENAVKVLGKSFVVVGTAEDVEISAEHSIKGRLGRYIGTPIMYKDTVKELMPELENINILTGKTKGIDCKIDGVYNKKVSFEIVSGNSVELYGNTVLGVKKGSSDIKVSSGNAERVIRVNVMSEDTIVPTKISIENTSSNFVKNKESVFKVTIEPDGATVDKSDIAVKSSKKAKIRHIEGLNYGITPEEEGEHTITVAISKYSLESNVLVSAASDGTVENPDIPGTKVDVEKIVLEDTYISLEVGDTKTIKVKNITPASATNKEVRYESMNTRYATIDKNGRVTGERAGTVKINVYSVSNPEVYATCTINVYDEDDRDDRDDKYRYPVDKVVIYREDNGKEVAIRNGKTDVMVSTEQQFVARIYPYNATNQEVRWYTSNSNIAEVDEDGMLTAYRVGEVELRVVTRDGNHRDSIKVEITEWMLKPTSIKIVNIDNSEVNTEVKTGDKLALKVNFEPLLTTERDVIWTITEGFHLFTLSKTGDVEFKEVGKATIKVYTKDYSTYTTLTFNITYSDDYWKDIGSTKNMSPRKAIEVKFSEALSISNIQNGNIFVATTRDGNTKAENVIMELVDGNRVLRVSSLSGEWEPEKTYYLLIKGASKSESGIQLIKNCRYTFETRKGRQSAK